MIAANAAAGNLLYLYTTLIFSLIGELIASSDFERILMSLSCRRIRGLFF
jgi:hypothetical protein